MPLFGRDRPEAKDFRVAEARDFHLVVLLVPDLVPEPFVKPRRPPFGSRLFAGVVQDLVTLLAHLQEVDRDATLVVAVSGRRNPSTQAEPTLRLRGQHVGDRLLGMRAVGKPFAGSLCLVVVATLGREVTKPKRFLVGAAAVAARRAQSNRAQRVR